MIEFNFVREVRGLDEIRIVAVLTHSLVIKRGKRHIERHYGSKDRDKVRGYRRILKFKKVRNPWHGEWKDPRDRPSIPH